MRDLEGVSPLHLACSAGNEDTILALIESGAKLDVNADACYLKVSPLHIAVSRSFPNIVAILLEAGAKIEAIDYKEQTPLFEAVSRGNVEMANLLLAYGANPNRAQINGYSPLSEAVERNNLVMVRLLLGNGAKSHFSHYLLHIAIMKSEEIALELITDGFCTLLRDDSGLTPLHVAFRVGSEPIVRALVNGSASYPLDPNDQSTLHGCTPLMMGIRWLEDTQAATLGTLLRITLKIGLDLNRYSPRLGHTALSLAIQLNKINLFYVLLSFGADPKIGDIGKVLIGREMVVPVLASAGYGNQGPMSLVECCRYVLRKYLVSIKPCEPLPDLVHLLPVPNEVKTYLKFYI